MKNGQLGVRKKWMEWALDFVNMDLGCISDGQKKRLREEVASFTDWDIVKDAFKDKLKFEEIALDWIQNALKHDVEKLLEGIKNRSLSLKLGYLISCLSIQKDSNEVDRLIIRNRPDYEAILGSVGTVGDSVQRILNINARLRFAELVNGLPIRCFVKCEGCGKHFVNFLRKEKTYCTTTCYSRVYAKNQRKKLRRNRKKFEVYKKKQRAYMRLRYQNLRKSDLGPNVQIQIGNRKED